jgi:hypothetical protein
MQVRKSEMEKKGTLGAFIIGSAIIWGAVILGCSWALKGTDSFAKISTLLIAGAGAHLIIIWGPLAAQMKKSDTKQ